MNDDKKNTKWPRPLQGVRVIDFSQLLPGPFCTHLLTEMGAETIKVEPPGGDPLRRLNPDKFNFYHRGKQSICIDARAPGAGDMLLNLIADADVLVEGFRPGVMDALRLGFEAASARNPHLIYASITGYGQDGPYARRPAHDINCVAAAGYFADALDINNDSLQRPRLRVSDYAAAWSSAFAIAALLRTPRAERRAAHVDASMFDGMAHLMLPTVLGTTPDMVEDPAQRHDVHADVALYETADGQALALATLEDKFWTALVDALRARFPALADAAWATRAGRSADKRRLAGFLRDMFGRLTMAEVRQALPPEDVCWSPVLRGADLLRDPQLQARGLLAEGPAGMQPTFPLAVNGSRPLPARTAPALGEHTELLAARYAPKR